MNWAAASWVTYARGSGSTLALVILNTTSYFRVGQAKHQWLTTLHTAWCDVKVSSRPVLYVTPPPMKTENLQLKSSKVDVSLLITLYQQQLICKQNGTDKIFI